jgi:hypothetical protein
MNAAHAVFSGFGRLNEENGSLFYVSRADVEVRRQAFAKSFLSWLPEPWRRKASELAAHAMLASLVWQAPRERHVVVLEFFAAYGVLFYLLMLAYPRPFYVFFMWDQEFARSGGYRLLALRMFRWFMQCSRCRAVQLEVGDACLPEALRLPGDKTVVVPMPTLEGAAPRDAQGRRPTRGPLRVGVVGMPRRDKKHLSERFLRDLLDCRAFLKTRDIEAQLILGVPLERENTDEALRYSGEFELVDTSKRRDYEKCLASLDILVCAFDECGYYYRSSGVICEAASYGVWIACPDFPVLRHQIGWPTPVGEVYGNSTSLEEAVLKVAEHRSLQGSDPHHQWVKTRRPELADRLIREHLVRRADEPRAA